MISISDLPLLNASLNAASALLLAAGYVLIRRRKITAHTVCMGVAFLTSIAFLISYLTLRYYAGMTTFPGQGWIRPVYFTILISHTVLAAAVVPLAVVTLLRALRERFDRHVRLARWTLPLWFYVSVTGVVVYWMLYQLYPTPHSEGGSAPLPTVRPSLRWVPLPASPHRSSEGELRSPFRRPRPARGLPPPLRKRGELSEDGGAGLRQDPRGRMSQQNVRLF